MAPPYVPDRGDLVWLHFGAPSGRRPALTISPKAYNRKVGLALFCPVTSRVKGYPFELALPDGLGVTGVVLCDQLRSLDWRTRGVERVESLAPSLVDDATALILALVDPR